MLNRLGNKSKLLPQLLPLFPKHIVTFVDLFYGSGAVSHAMLSKCKYLIANDLDADVANLFDVWRTRPAELADALEVVPYHSDVLRRFREQPESDDIGRAVAFVYRSNFSFLSKGKTLKFGASNARQIALNAIKEGFRHIAKIQFLSVDFRRVLDSVCVRHERDLKGFFVFADPPYLGTEHDSYNMATAWTTSDTADLFELLSSSGMRFAISEFDGAFVRDLAREHGLTVTVLGERRNIGNRRTEVLITNYNPQPAQASLFLPSTTA